MLVSSQQKKKSNLDCRYTNMLGFIFVIISSYNLLECSIAKTRFELSFKKN